MGLCRGGGRCGSQGSLLLLLLSLHEGAGCVGCDGIAAQHGRVCRCFGKALAL